jgi:type IV pilus assembly protein PilM
VHKIGIGLDIGTRKITLVKARKTNRGIEIRKFGSRATPESAMDAGQIQDTAFLGSILRDLVDELGLYKQKVAVAVSAPNVYTRIIVMPRMKKKDLHQAIKYKAFSFLPVPVEEVIIDYFPLREYSDFEGEKTEIFFAAVRKQQVERLQEVCRLGGVKLQVADMEELALHRLLKEEKVKSKAFLFVDAWRSNFWIAQDGEIYYQRHIYLGYCGLRPGMALRYGYSEPDTHNNRGNIDYIKEYIAREVALSMEYCATRSKILVSQISVIGRGAVMPGLVDAIAEQCKCKVAGAGIWPLICRVQNHQTLDELKYDYPVALGLAIRGGR